MRRHRPAALALSAAAATVLLAGCSSDGVEAVADDEGFSSCIEDAGASLDGSSDWDEKQQLAFWAEPGTLDCALDELDPGDRKDALAGGFQEPDDGDDGAASAQRTVLRDWATRSAEDRSESDAADRAGVLLSSLWMADADEPGPANGAEALMAFSLYVAADGEPTGFDDYLAHHTGTVTDPNDQVLRFVDRMQEDTSQEQEWKRLESLIEDIDDAYDDSRDAG